MMTIERFITCWADRPLASREAVIHEFAEFSAGWANDGSLESREDAETLQLVVDMLRDLQPRVDRVTADVV